MDSCDLFFFTFSYRVTTGNVTSQLCLWASWIVKDQNQEFKTWDNILSLPKAPIGYVYRLSCREKQSCREKARKLLSNDFHWERCSVPFSQDYYFCFTILSKNTLILLVWLWRNALSMALGQQTAFLLSYRWVTTLEQMS